MGSVRIDTNKSQLRHDTIHPYTSTGIRRLLRDIHKLWTEEIYHGDYDAVNIRIDLESALQSNATTPRQRAAIALYYMVQLTQAECAKILGIEKRNVGRRLENGVANLAAYMQGDKSTSSQIVGDKDRIRGDCPHLSAWLDFALQNTLHWWDADDAVYAELNSIFGMPNRNDTVQPQSSGYPYKTTSELRPKHEVLMEEPYVKPTPTIKNQKYYSAIGSEQDDDYDGLTDDAYEHKKFYVRLPNDRRVKRYGSFWTERK